MGWLLLSLFTTVAYGAFAYVGFTDCPEKFLDITKKFGIDLDLIRLTRWLTLTLSILSLLLTCFMATYVF